MQILTHKNQNRVPIHMWGKKRPVGDVYLDRKTFRKTIYGSRHILRSPTPSLAFDVSILRQVLEVGAVWAEVYDNETKTTYRAKIDHILTNGFIVNHGWGVQRALPLENWIRKTEPVQLGLFGGNSC